MPSQTEIAYRHIRATLAEGRYRPSDRVSESAIAQELEMSRTPVREALRRLQADGLLHASGRGLTVPSLEPEQASQLFAVRAALESLAAELAAARQHDGHVPPASIEALREAARAFEDAVESGADALAAANLELHQQIARLAANPYLEDALGRIWDLIAMSSAAHFGDRRWRRTVVADHRRLVAAIAAGRRADAADVARRHIEAAARRGLGEAAAA
jgi:DNA-binding GntR family transcriptional regulator